MWGEDAIPSEWLNDLEGANLIGEVADDLAAAFVDGAPVDSGKYPPW